MLCTRRVETPFGKMLLPKEMKDVIPSLQKLDNEDIVPIGYQQVNFHMIFDVSMEAFWRKARLVAVGNVTEPPATVTYEYVVSRETVYITLTLSTLNNFPVKVVDIQNSYITESVTEKIWTVLGCEFDEESGRKATVVRALYGLNSSRYAFHNHLAD